MITWDYCSSEEHCEEDEYETVMENRFLGMRQKKFPVFSHRALPEGVNQNLLATALDMVASREAQKVLSR